MSHRTLLNLLLIFCCAGVGLAFISDELRVTLPNGSKLVGRYLRSFSGRTIRGFTNVPYAKPPIGPLRFKVSCSKNKRFDFVNFKLNPIQVPNKCSDTIMTLTCAFDNERRSKCFDHNDIKFLLCLITYSQSDYSVNFPLLYHCRIHSRWKNGMVNI